MLQHLARFGLTSLFRSLLLAIDGSTQRKLARQVRYLKIENEILRSKLTARITITQKERQRLVKFGAKLGTTLHQLVTIVTPGAILRWIREEKRADRKRTADAGPVMQPRSCTGVIMANTGADFVAAIYQPF